MNSNLKKLLSAAAICAVLAFSWGCGEDAPAPGSEGSSVPVSEADIVSSAVVSGADVSGSDASADWYDTLSGEEKAVADIILRSAEAMNARDIEAYMSTVDPESEVYGTTREDTESVFSHYRLAVTVENLTVDSIRQDTAVVTVTQTTLPVVQEEDAPVSGSDVVSSADVTSSGDVVSSADAVSNTDLNSLTGTDKTRLFDPCETVLTHTLVRRDGAWYISSTVIESYREISTQWELLAAISAAEPSVFVLSGDGSAVSAGDVVSEADAVSGSDSVQ